MLDLFIVGISKAVTVTANLIIIIKGLIMFYISWKTKSSSNQSNFQLILKLNLSIEANKFLV
jgi:hypothetical protein